MSINFKNYGNYITLDEDEKRKFSQSNHEYIIEQLQLNDGEQGIQTTSNVEVSNNELSEMTVDLNFQHPVKYLTWVIVNKGTLNENSGMGPRYFCSLTNNSLYGNDGNYGSADIYIGGIEREITLSMTHFTRYQYLNYDMNIPQLDRIGFIHFV